MQEVKSNMISHVGHDPETNTLRVRFKNGGQEYEYPTLTAEEHAALIGAESIGKHFQTHIRPKHAGNKIPGSIAS